MSRVGAAKCESFHYRFIGLSIILHCVPLFSILTLPGMEEDPLDEPVELIEHVEVLDKNVLTNLTQKAIESFPEEVMLSPDIFNHLPALIHEGKDGDVSLMDVYTKLQKRPKAYHQVVLLSMPPGAQKASADRVHEARYKRKLAALLRLNRKLSFLEKKN